ncbi:MAG: hypothetical protein EOP53_17445 [Sphingobacteriales bacterium]|nr:MAG: hypothetical protein EOP53_17445 [Sphingobacteriales bacterium]
MRRMIFLAVLVYAIAAYFSVGYFHPDEHFQVLEFAGLKWGVNQKHDLAWEYREQMRPAFQPAIVVALYRFYGWFSEPNPFIIITFLRYVSAALSLGGILLFINTFKEKIGTEKLQRWFVLLSFFLWFTVFNNVRYSSESWSGSFFLLSLTLVARQDKRSSWKYFLIGILLGISFLCRYQAALLIFGLGLWMLFIAKENFKHIALVVTGFLVVFAAGFFIDFWFYENWVFTSWQYFEQNILLGKASGFGVEPFWHFASETFLSALPPFSLFYIFATLIFIYYRPKSIITWSLVPFMFIHHITAHKELRFLFPIVNFLPFMMIESLQIIQQKSTKIKAFLQTKAARRIERIFWISNICILLVVMFKPVDRNIPLYRFLFNRYTSDATLYSVVGDPYLRALNVRYYKRPGLYNQPIKSLSEIPVQPGRTQLLIVDDKQTISQCGCTHKLIYQNFPDWMEVINFNNWEARSNRIYVYEIQKIPSSVNSEQ